MSNDQISKTISHAIEEQFPGVYREDAEIMVAFMKAYYEFLETQDKYATKVSRQMFEANDIDRSLDEFIVHFKEKYLADIPFESFTDKRFMNKHIMDLYRSKGSEQSIELFMKLVYNQDAKVYYPGRDILKPSESIWRRWPYIEVDKNARSRDMINREITGSRSGAKAFVENVVTKRVSGKLVDVLFLSSVRGNFVPGERVSENGVLKNAPIVTGSLTGVNIAIGGRDNKIGDVFDVIGGEGVRGKVRVAEVEDATGRVDFAVQDGGWGYSNSSSSFDSTVYVAKAMIGNDNSNPRYQFLDFENVVQRIEKLTLLSATDFNTDVSLGTDVVGIDSGDQTVVTGRVISIANTDANGDVISTASANSVVTLQVLDGGTFSDLVMLELSAAGIVNAEIVEEESLVTFNITANTGVFSPGDNVFQTLLGVANTVVYRNEAVVVTANDTVITTNGAFGDWTDSVVLQRVDDPTDTATISSVVTTAAGARGEVKAVDGANVDVQIISGTFDTGQKLRGRQTLLTRDINASSVAGAVDIHVSGNTSSNGVIDTITNMDAKGVMIAQNTSYVGLWGNTSAFFNHEDYEFFVETERDALISPPKFEWYDPALGLTANFRPGDGDVFDIDDIRGAFTATDIRTNDVVVKARAKLPSPLENGILWEVGGTTHGSIVALAPYSVDNTKVALRAFAGEVGVTTNHAAIEVAPEVLPEDGLFHDFEFHLEPDNGILRFYIDGFLMDQANTSDGSALTGNAWLDANTGSYTTRAGTDDAGDDIGYIFATHGDWKGEVSGTLDFFVGGDANTAAAPGNIVEIRRPITDIGTGFGADFDVGIIEDTENAILNTDLLGANNVANVPFINVNLDGSNSGTGFVDSVTINDGGTMYSNGSIVTFAGGGYANGTPYVSAEGSITTDGAGVITSITVTEPGSGYFGTPTPVLPATGGSVADVEAVMDFGYGFPELPDGDLNTLLTDVLQTTTLEIGKIATLTRINPGTDYNLDQFVRVRQNLVAAYDRHDFYALVSNTSGGFVVGEDLTQDIGGSSTAKGKVKRFEVIDGQAFLYIDRNSFSVAFEPTYPLTGATSGATAYVDDVYQDESTDPIGDNANVTGTVIAANGIVTEVEVIDSGYGYIDDAEVSLQREGFQFVISGTTDILRQGISEGHWETTDSHLSSEKKIQDSFYYQEYSYDVISGIALTKYKDSIKQILHVSGNEIFGSISKITKIDSKATVADSTIEVV